MKFPFRVTLLIWLVLILIVWNLLRIWTALSWQATLIEFSAAPSPWVTAISGGVFVLSGLIIIWSVWQAKPWTPKLLLGVTTGYTVWYWSERLFRQNPRPNWLFAVIVNLVIVIFILYTARSLTREAYERES